MTTLCGEKRILEKEFIALGCRSRHVIVIQLELWEKAIAVEETLVVIPVAETGDRKGFLLFG